MMSKDDMNSRNQFAVLTIDDLVLQDHLIRKIDAAFDSEFIYPIAETIYSDLGHPSIDPVILIKLVFIQYLFGTRPIRQTIKEVSTNVTYRWFLSYSFKEKIPHSSTFGKNYVRRLRRTTVFEDTLTYILEQAVKAGFATEDSSYSGSIRTKANANKHKFTREMAHNETKAYQNELEDEISRQQIEAGKRPFTLDLEKEVKLKERKISKTDPENGYYVKGEREKQLAYSVHISCDGNESILNTTIIPGNIHDSQVTLQLVKQSKRLFPEVSYAIADAEYKIPKFVHSLTYSNLRPCLSYSGLKGKKGLLSKNESFYDKYFDCYTCSQDQMLTSSTVTREGYRGYRPNPKERVDCPLLNQCIISKNHQRVITGHVWGNLMGGMEHLRLTDLNKSIYKKRKQTIERISADAKEKHRMC